MECCYAATCEDCGELFPIPSPAPGGSTPVPTPGGGATSSTSGGAVAGGVVGALAAAGLALFFYRRRALRSKRGSGRSGTVLSLNGDGASALANPLLSADPEAEKRARRLT